ncbi:hypothetical protein HUJ04_012867, partial [Dendroctonus ponderosae]
TDKKTTADRERKTFAVIVENKAKPYNENLQNVKDAFGGKNIVEGIKEIRSTRDGRLMIVTDKKQDIVDQIYSTLQSQNRIEDHIKIIGKYQQRESIHIRGQDSLAKKEDVVAALQTSIPNIQENNYHLSDIRPNSNNTQAITITINKEMADTLVKEKTIRIGMVRCSMEPRIQCPRGHTNISHKDVHVDRSKLCFVCGEEGHTAKGCEKETSCPICQKSGHRAGSEKCEAFKRLLFVDRKQFKKLLYQNKNMQREESDMGITQMETNVSQITQH